MAAESAEEDWERCIALERFSWRGANGNRKERGRFQVRRMQLATSFTAEKWHKDGDPRDKSVSTQRLVV